MEEETKKKQQQIVPNQLKKTFLSREQNTSYLTTGSKHLINMAAITFVDILFIFNVIIIINCFVFGISFA
jgi:hypothetical protein